MENIYLKKKKKPQKNQWNSLPLFSVLSAVIAVTSLLMQLESRDFVWMHIENFSNKLILENQNWMRSYTIHSISLKYRGTPLLVNGAFHRITAFYFVAVGIILDISLLVDSDQHININWFKMVLVKSYYHFWRFFIRSIDENGNCKAKTLMSTIGTKCSFRNIKSISIPPVLTKPLSKAKNLNI